MHEQSLNSHVQRSCMKSVRFMIGCMMLSIKIYFYCSNGFRSTLPVVSNLTAMNIWDGFSMFFIYVSLLEFVVVNYIGRKRPRRPLDLTTAPQTNAQVMITIKLLILSGEIAIKHILSLPLPICGFSCFLLLCFHNRADLRAF